MPRTGSNRGGLWKGEQMTLALNMLLLKHLLEGILRKHWEMWVGDQRGWSWAAVTGTKNGGWSHGNRRALSKWAVKSKKREGSRIEFWGRPKCTVRAGRGTEERKETEQGVQGDWGRVGGASSEEAREMAMSVRETSSTGLNSAHVTEPSWAALAGRLWVRLKAAFMRSLCRLSCGACHVAEHYKLCICEWMQKGHKEDSSTQDLETSVNRSSLTTEDMWLNYISLKAFLPVELNSDLRHRLTFS